MVYIDGIDGSLYYYVEDFEIKVPGVRSSGLNDSIPGRLVV